MYKLNNANHVSEEEIGGKALRLARLMSAGFMVKPGIVLTVDEVNEIVRSGLFTEMYSEEFRSITSETTVAVRSSAVGEDGTDASWAGQFKTKLFVPVARVTDAILECAAARNSDSVLAYAAKHHLTVGKLALIIQEMVDVAFAGVLFTADPLAPAHHEMVIEAVDGVGEELVNGLRTPRRYRIREDGTVLVAEGALLPELTVAQLAELAAVGQKVRDLFGREQDIEWAIERGTGTLWLLQSRDITVFHQKKRVENSVIFRRNQIINEVRTTTDKELCRLACLGLVVKSDMWSDQNIAELLTPHPCQMAFDLFTTVFAHGGAIRRGRNEIGYEIGSELDAGFFRLIGGQPRCSIVHDACTYRIRGFTLPEYGKLVEYYLARIAEDSRLGNYPEVVLYDQNPSLKFLVELYGKRRGGELRTAYDRFFRNLRISEDNFDSICQKEFIPHWQETISALHRMPPASDIFSLIKRLYQLFQLLRDDVCVAFVKGARLGFFAFARLRRLLQELYGNEGEHYLNVVTAGIPVERNPNLRFNKALAGVRQGTCSLREVSEEYGHLALHELEISVPRYVDNPDLLARLADQMESDPMNDLHDSEAKSQTVSAEIMRSVGSRAVELEREIHLARTYLSLREMIKFEYLKAYQLIRQALCAMERILKWEDGFIFHLTVKEVCSLNTQSQMLESQARKRREEKEADHSFFIPSVFGTERLEDIGNPRVSRDDRFLYGIGATNEIAEGEVVVMHHYNFNDRETMAMIKPGIILVTTTTDPAWSPVLALIGKTGGLVTEVGGLLAHGAIYAREMGFAAVLNVPEATTKIKTGMCVRVHGPGGYVEIIKK